MTLCMATPGTWVDSRGRVCVTGTYPREPANDGAAGLLSHVQRWVQNQLPHDPWIAYVDVQLVDLHDGRAWPTLAVRGGRVVGAA